FQPKAAAILGDLTLQMKRCGRVGVLLVQQIINAGRQVEVFDEVLAEKGEVHNAVSINIHAWNRLPRRSRKKRAATAGVLEFQAGEDFLFDDGHADVEFDELLRRIRQGLT